MSLEPVAVLPASAPRKELGTNIGYIYRIHDILRDGVKVADTKASALFGAYSLMATVLLGRSAAIAQMAESKTMPVSAALASLLGVANVGFFLYTTIHAFLVVKARIIKFDAEVKDAKKMMWFADIMGRRTEDYVADALSLTQEDVIRDVVSENYKICVILKSKFYHLNRAYLGFMTGFFAWIMLVGLSFLKK